MTEEDFEKIGKSCRDAVDGNLLVGSFAADLVDESYPFSKTMAEIVFRTYSNIELGKRFEEWIRETKQ